MDTEIVINKISIKKYKNITCSQTENILDVLNKINNNGKRIIFVIDKNKYKTWLLFKRSGPLDSGVGVYEIVDTTLPNRELFIGMKCTYAIKYMDEINFTKSKCKITEKMEKVFQQVANEIKD